MKRSKYLHKLLPLSSSGTTYQQRRKRRRRTERVSKRKSQQTVAKSYKPPESIYHALVIIKQRREAAARKKAGLPPMLPRRHVGATYPTRLALGVATTVPRVISPVVKIGAAALASGGTVAYAQSRLPKSNHCEKRTERRRAIFSTGRAGKGKHGPYKRTETSKEPC